MLEAGVRVKLNALISISYAILSIGASHTELASSLCCPSEAHALSLKHPSCEASARGHNSAGPLPTRSQWILKCATIITLHHVNVTRIDNRSLDLDEYLTTSWLRYIHKVTRVVDFAFRLVDDRFHLSRMFFH